MALFESAPTDKYLGRRRRHPGALVDRRRERTSSNASTRSSRASTTRLRTDPASRSPAGDRPHEHSPGRSRARGRRRHGHQPRALPARCTDHRHRLVAKMLEKAQERIVRKGLRNCRVMEMDAAALTFPDDFVRHRLRAVPDQRGARPGGGGPRDVPGLQAGRPHHHPQPLQEREPGASRRSSGRSRR